MFVFITLNLTQIELASNPYIMDGMLIQILGLVAGAITISSSLPQIIKIIKSKKTADLSLQTYILINLGGALWVVYGLVTEQIAILIPNVIFLVLNGIILYLKIRMG